MSNDNATSTAAYWIKRDAELDAAAADDVAYAQSYAGRLEAAQRRLNLVTGDYAAYTDADRTEALAVLAELKAEADAAFAAAWTLETTTERRAAWNALVRSGALDKSKGKIDFGKVATQEARQGWTAGDLKRAIALHSL